MANNDNPMPREVYQEMLRYLPLGSAFDLHHALVDKGDVRGMSISERRKIHSKFNLWWVRSADHASHADIEDKRHYYWLLCDRFGKPIIDAYIRSFNWKSTPPVTVEWLESDE